MPSGIPKRGAGSKLCGICSVLLLLLKESDGKGQLILKVVEPCKASCPLSLLEAPLLLPTLIWLQIVALQKQSAVAG